MLYPPDEAGQSAEGPDGERSQWGSLGTRIPPGITHSSAASFVFVVTYSQARFNIPVAQ